MPAGEPPPYQYPQHDERHFYSGLFPSPSPIKVELLAVSDSGDVIGLFATFETYAPPRVGERIEFSDTPLSGFTGEVKQVDWHFGDKMVTVRVYVRSDLES